MWFQNILKVPTDGKHLKRKNETKLEFLTELSGRLKLRSFSMEGYVHAYFLEQHNVRYKLNKNCFN